MDDYLDILENKLLERKKNRTLRKLLHNNDNLIDFCSNDYLGLSKEKITFPKKFNHSASTGSRLLTGNYSEIPALEKEIAYYFNFESALLYSSGFLANLGLLQSCIQRDHIVIYDQLVHASIRYGIELSKAKNINFKHNNLKDLEEKLKRNIPQAKTQWVIIESLYSMSGDSPDLLKIVNLCDKYKALLIVDEAHAFGTIGVNGKGLIDSLNLQKKVFACIITFGKSFAANGAIVLSNSLIKNFQVNFSAPFIYSTAPCTTQTHIIQQRFNFIKCHLDKLYKKLTDKLVYFKLQCKKNNLSAPFSNNDSPIFIIKIKDIKKVKALSNKLRLSNIDIRAILYPTVSKKDTCLRLIIHTFNTKKEINLLVSKLKLFL